MNITTDRKTGQPSVTLTAAERKAMAGALPVLNDLTLYAGFDAQYREPAAQAIACLKLLMAALEAPIPAESETPALKIGK